MLAASRSREQEMRFYKGLFDHVLYLLQDSGQFFIYMGGDREHWTVNFEYPSLFVKFLCLIPDKNLSVKETLLFFFFTRNSNRNWTR